MIKKNSAQVCALLNACKLRPTADPHLTSLRQQPNTRLTPTRSEASRLFGLAYQAESPLEPPDRSRFCLAKGGLYLQPSYS